MYFALKKTTTWFDKADTDRVSAEEPADMDDGDPRCKLCDHSHLKKARMLIRATKPNQQRIKRYLQSNRLKRTLTFL